MTSLRVATVQFELRREPSVEAFLAHVDSLVGQAAAGGAKAVLFPELADTGLLGAITDHTVTTKTISTDYWEGLSRFTPQIVEGLKALASRHAVTLVGGSHIRVDEEGNLRNTAYLVSPDGAVKSQDKIHLTPQEHDLGIKGGDELLVAQVGDFTAGVLICADIQFPELSRHLVQQGVDLVFCPSLTWNSRGVHRVRTGCQARAIENQLYVVMSPLVGHSGLPEDAPMHAKGRALVSCPVDRTFGVNDGLLAHAADDTEQILFVDLDREKLLASRAQPEAPGLRLQRPELYAALAAERSGR